MNKAVHINRDLLKKYDRPGPRYTSYPTVPAWTSTYGPDDYLEALHRTGSHDKPVSLYFHIPFCESRCAYCGCTTVITQNQNRVESYLRSLNTEMDMVTKAIGSRKRISQMHWGGGTPTFMSVNQIKALYTSITQHFDLDGNAEIAIEVDPRVTTIEQITALRSLGFNRISMGVQDLTPAVQKAIGRDQTLEQTRELFIACRDAGFTGINVDLIYGLPLQTVANFSETIDRIIEWGADRVAVYSFAYLPTLKPHQKIISPDLLPTASDKYDLFATAVENFLGAGYRQIGMDHFARPDDELSHALDEGRLYRNFMGYTSRVTTDSIGFGMSAISELAGHFAQNLSKIDAYGKRLEAGKTAIFRGYRLTDDDHIRQQAILALMCNFRLVFADLDKQFNIDSRSYFTLELEELNQFIEDDLVVCDRDSIAVTPAGRLFVRNIAMVFDTWLRQQEKEGPTHFSRTI